MLFQSSAELADATHALVHTLAAQSCAPPAACKRAGCRDAPLTRFARRRRRRYALNADASFSAAAVVTPPRAAAAALAGALGALVEPPATSASPSLATHDTLVHLTAQAGFASLRHDERVLAALLAAAPPGGVAALSTPYCNVWPPTERALGAAASATVQLLTAAPEAHGFAGATGVASFVPDTYGVMVRGTEAGILLQ